MTNPTRGELREARRQTRAMKQERRARRRLGQPLAVFRDQDHCSGKGEHLVRIVSDGLLAYVYLPQGSSEPAVRREGTKLIVVCGDVHPVTDEECFGEIVFDLSTPGTWVSDVGPMNLLARFGTLVDR